MAHLLAARQSGAVAEVKVTLAKDQYNFVVDVAKWDEANSSVVRLGERKFTLPASLYKAFSVTHLKERLGTVLPPVQAGGEYQGTSLTDDSTLLSAGVAPSDGEEAAANIVFNLDKNPGASSSGASAASPRTAAEPAGLSRTTSVQVKAGTGPIMSDRELNFTLTIWQDSGNNYVTVNATNNAQGINFDSKLMIADSYWGSMTVKELKRKLGNSFPPTSERGTLQTGNTSKNIRDNEKWGALGVKGKRGETLKWSGTFELGGGASSGSSQNLAPAAVTGEPAPEIDPKLQLRADVSLSLMEGNVFLKFTCTSDVLPEMVKSAALPKVSYQVFNVRDLRNLLKGPTWPILAPGWVALENSEGKWIKVADATSLPKVGVDWAQGKTTNFKFIFPMDPNAALPSVKD
jgi:hypothetical protein